jgi:hypothetical protein
VLGFIDIVFVKLLVVNGFVLSLFYCTVINNAFFFISSDFDLLLLLLLLLDFGFGFVIFYTTAGF